MNLEIHYLYGGNGLAAIYVKTDGKDTLFAAVTDRQNSLTAVMDVATGKIEKFSYKPWGMRRNPANWSENVVTDYPTRFSRGYCMHEHFFIKYQINDFNMRIFVFVIMILLSVELFAKRSNFNEIPVENISQLDKMGIEDSLLLNEYESDYFNVVYKDSLNRFDFSGKKVGFICGGAKSSKKEYFD